eukprot:5185155-Alexandrium_andersonii.AAC.1
MCAGHKAWGRGPPAPQHLKQLFFRHPRTQIVTCARRGAAAVNEAAIKARYGKKKPLAVLPGDVD